MSQASPSLDDLFARMRAVQRREPVPTWPLRARRLRALQALIRDNRPAIAAAIEADFGQRPADETDLLEVFPSLSALRHTLRHGRRWMRPRQRMAGFRLSRHAPKSGRSRVAWSGSSCPGTIHSIWRRDR